MRGVREIAEAAKMLMEKGQRMNECRRGEQVQGKMIACEPVNNQRIISEWGLWGDGCRLLWLKAGKTAQSLK